MTKVKPVIQPIKPNHRNVRRAHRVQNALIRPVSRRTSPFSYSVSDRLYSGRGFSHHIFWLQLYHKEWTAQKIVDIPVHDMLRKRWDVNNLNKDQHKRYLTGLKRFNFYASLRQALKLERLLGGSALILGVRGQDTEEAKQPLDLSSIGKGDLRFVNVIPRTDITSYSLETNPLSEAYGRPQSYVINGYEIHQSRLLIFDGDPISPNRRDVGLITQSNDGFGESVLAPVFDDIVRSVGSRNAAVQLIKRASVLLIQSEKTQIQNATQGGQNQNEELQQLADSLDMFSAAIVDGKSINLDQWSANFGSVPQLMEQFLQIISAASDIPATRFLSVAPGGLNATGKSDLENYYNMIDDKRESRLHPALDKFHQVYLRSELPEIEPNDIEIEFPPLWNPSKVEDTQAELNEANVIVSLVQHDIMTRDQARIEAKERGLFKTEFDEDELELPPLDDTDKETPDLKTVTEQLDAIKPTSPTD